MLFIFNNPRDSWRGLTSHSLSHIVYVLLWNKKDKQTQRQLKKNSVIFLSVHLLMEEDNQHPAYATSITIHLYHRRNGSQKYLYARKLIHYDQFRHSLERFVLSDDCIINTGAWYMWSKMYVLCIHVVFPLLLASLQFCVKHAV